MIVLWGLNFLAIRVGLDHFPPFFFAALRFLVIAIPVVMFVPRPHVTVRWLLLYGFGFGFVQFVFLFCGDGKRDAHRVSRHWSCSRRRRSPSYSARSCSARSSADWQVSGIAVAVGGMVFIGWDRSHHAALLPVILTLLGGLGWAFGNLGSRLGRGEHRRRARTDALDAVDVRHPAVADAALSAVVEGPTAGWHALGTAFSADVWPSLVGLAYIILLGTIAGSGLWTMLMGRYPAGMVAPFSLLVPVVGIGASWIVPARGSEPVVPDRGGHRDRRSECRTDEAQAREHCFLGHTCSLTTGATRRLTMPVPNSGRGN